VVDCHCKGWRQRCCGVSICCSLSLSGVTSLCGGVSLCGGGSPSRRRHCVSLCRRLLMEGVPSLCGGVQAQVENAVGDLLLWPIAMTIYRRGPPVSQKSQVTSGKSQVASRKSQVAESQVTSHTHSIRATSHTVRHPMRHKAPRHRGEVARRITCQGSNCFSVAGLCLCLSP